MQALCLEVVHANYKYILYDSIQITKVIGEETISYEYDSNGRLRRGTNRVGSVEIEYDRNGHPSRIIYPNGHGLSYGYNSKNQWTYIADNLGYNVTYTYYDEHN